MAPRSPDAGTNALDDGATAPPLPARQRRFVLAGMMLGMSLAAMDQMILSTAVAAISGELGDLSQAPWLFTANLLTSSSTMPIWGKLGDLYGRRRVFQAAIGIFVVAALLASTSTTMTWLVVCRALQGLGGGGILTIPHAIVADVTPPRLRAATLAYTAAVWAGSGLVGPLLGGFLVDGPGWRWMFILSAPLGLLASVFTQLGHRLPQRRIEHRVDIAGALLLFFSVGCLIVYTSWALGALGATSTGAISLLVASVLLALGFVAQERRAEEPILDMALMRIPGIRAPLLTTCLFGFGNFSMAFFIPLFAIVVNGRSATEAGLALMPLPVGLFLASAVVGRRSAATGRYRRYPMGGLLAYIVGALLMSTLDVDTPIAAFWTYSFILGIGSGSIGHVIVASLQNSVDARHLGVVSSLPAFGRAVAQTIGTSALGAFLALRLHAHLARVASPLSPGTSIQSLAASPESVHGLVEPLRSQVIEAWRASLSDTFLVVAGIMAVSFVASTFIRDSAARDASP